MDSASRNMVSSGSSTPDRTFNCSKCPLVFDHESQLSRHRLMEHRICVVVHNPRYRGFEITCAREGDMFRCGNCNLCFKPVSIYKHARNCKEKPKHLEHLDQVHQEIEPSSSSGIIVPNTSSLDEVARQALAKFNQQKDMPANTGNDDRMMPWFFRYTGWNKWIDSLAPPQEAMCPYLLNAMESMEEEEANMFSDEDTDSDDDDGDDNDSFDLNTRNNEARVSAFKLMALKLGRNEKPILDTIMRAVLKMFQGSHALLSPMKLDGTLRRQLMESRAKPNDRTGMKQLSKDTTVHRYAMQGARLVASLVRLVEEPEKYHSSLSQDLPDICSQLAKSIVNMEPDNEDAIIEKAEQLLWYVFIECISNPQAGPFEFVGYRALVWGCVTFQRRFPRLSAITSHVSMFEYWCRVLVLRKICIEKESVPSMLQVLDTNRSSIFNALSDVKDIATSSRLDETSILVLMWVPGTEKRELVITRSQQIVSLVDLQGASVDSDLAISDDMTNYEAGYSFLVEPHNQFHRLHSIILRSILADTQARSKMIDRIDNEDIYWRHDEGHRWLSRAKELQKYLFVLIHMISGQPSRGEELAQLRIDNSVWNDRNVFWSRAHQTIMLLSQYNKSRERTHRDYYVARFLPLDVSMMLGAY
ncbi:predicted protein [Lichtheimia corymbifera JMRC:FSU:9682]|uniref:C2H2-type domain-containing protein n=1 Tax=Lichtheimia corymbifera JMRC:FSU:9682 TaxID=1263082 RepID=A0A068SGD7_9FUNG|nr:predicted protein [Lichtheimia corymbifera JMRC:FSU:9682]